MEDNVFSIMSKKQLPTREKKIMPPRLPSPLWKKRFSIQWWMAGQNGQASCIDLESNIVNEELASSSCSKLNDDGNNNVAMETSLDKDIGMEPSREEVFVLDPYPEEKYLSNNGLSDWQMQEYEIILPCFQVAQEDGANKTFPHFHVVRTKEEDRKRQVQGSNHGANLFCHDD
eukprot:Gb_41493 [translate_table: standard]